MKINGLQVETVKGQCARYGLSKDGRMRVMFFNGSSDAFTAEQAYSFSDETRKAAQILLVDDVRNVEPAGEAAASAENPADIAQNKETERLPKPGEKIKIVDASMTSGLYKNGDVLTVNKVAGSTCYVAFPGTRFDASHCDGGRAVCNSEYIIITSQPAPAPWKPAVGDLVQIVRPIDGFDVGDIVKVDHVCTDFNQPHVKGKSGLFACLPSGSYLPVREVDRPAKVGEWVKVIKLNGGGIAVGSIVKCTLADSDNYNLFDGGRCMLDNKYRVLEPYSPEVPHA